MERTMTASVLTINGGSSSIKFAVFERGEPPARKLAGKIERIGLADASLVIDRCDGSQPERQAIDAANHEQAAARLFALIDQHVGADTLSAIGHRVVHGGPQYTAPARITPELVEELRRLSPLDPDHLPSEIALIETFGRLRGDLPQVACFDTAFHRDLPRMAKILPLPRRYEAAGVRRYGFHGLSFEFLLGELARRFGAEAARGRVILAHLGAGASLAAVRDGKCIDTSMGFTPTAGLVMGTRTGDLDPAR